MTTLLDLNLEDIYERIKQLKIDRVHRTCSIIFNQLRNYLEEKEAFPLERGTDTICDFLAKKISETTQNPNERETLFNYLVENYLSLSVPLYERINKFAPINTFATRSFYNFFYLAHIYATAEKLYIETEQHITRYPRKSSPIKLLYLLSYSIFSDINLKNDQEKRDTFKTVIEKLKINNKTQHLYNYVNQLIPLNVNSTHLLDLFINAFSLFEGMSSYIEKKPNHSNPKTIASLLIKKINELNPFPHESDAIFTIFVEKLKFSKKTSIKFKKIFNYIHSKAPLNEHQKRSFKKFSDTVSILNSQEEPAKRFHSFWNKKNIEKQIIQKKSCEKKTGQSYHLKY